MVSNDTMRLKYAAAVLTVAASVSVFSQSATPARFEVASIKPNKSGDVFTRFPGGRGQYQVINILARDLITTAFNVRGTQLVGAPDWTQVERFDIAARPPADVQFTPAIQTAMLRTLLEERFKLVTHRETREMPVLALVLARADGKVPPSLVPASPECAPGGSRRLGPGPDGRPQLPPPGQKSCATEGLGRGGFRSGYLTMEGLAAMVGARLGRNVVDRTGLAGGFELEVTFNPEAAPTAGAAPQAPSVDLGPSLVTALQEQLGLKLDSTRAPVEVLVVDSVDRPTPD